MSTFTKQVILFAISLIEYVMAWEPAPVDTALNDKLEELRVTLKSHTDPVTEAEKKASV